MIRLALVRHAKSDWGTPGLDDHDRPLNARGLRDAPAMAQRLAASGFAAQAILSSTALRARTTAGFFGDEFGIAPVLLEELYGAPAAVLLGAAEASGVDSVIVVAHDPGMSELAERLSGEIAHMPTCAVATFTWQHDGWDVATSLEPDAWTFDTPR